MSKMRFVFAKLVTRKSASVAAATATAKQINPGGVEVGIAMRVSTGTAIVLGVLNVIVRSTEAWSVAPQRGDILRPPNLIDSNHRRNVISSIIGTVTSATLIVLAPNTAQAAAATTTNPKLTTAINELKESRDKLKEIPDLLEAKEWDKVRSILKVPPVNKLWNLGDVRMIVIVRTRIKQT